MNDFDTFSAASTATLLSDHKAAPHCVTDVHPEKLLAVRNGRTLAYTEGGDPSSSTVVVAFHGIFSIGQVGHMPSSLLAKGRHVHLLAPTLPGWGRTSPPRHISRFAACVIADVTALLKHLGKDTADLRLYVSGSKYGSIPAQILYGAPFDVFPLGRHIAALLVTHPFSPYRSYTQYTSSFNFVTWMMFGAPSYVLPSNLFLRFHKRSLAHKLATPEGAQSLVHWMYSLVSATEHETFMRTMKKRGLTEEQVVRQRAQAAMLSVSQSWAGYLAIPYVVRSDWGFRPAALDDEHARRPIVIVSQKGSTMGQQLVREYRNVHAIYCRGADSSTVRSTEEIWERFLSMGPKN